MVDTATDKKVDASGAIIVDFGKRKRKDVKALRKGAGPLLDDVNDCISELAAAGKLAANVQPVIVVVREKTKRRSAWPLPY